MNRRHALMIAALSLIWGASFMFIKVAVRQFDPAALVWLRLMFACAVLVPAALLAEGRGALRDARAAWVWLALLGVVNTAIPFLLISWAEIRLDSGLAAILQAAAPIFSAVISTRFGGDRVTGLRLAGVLVGFAGVGLLVGSPGGGGLPAALAVVLAALAYAIGANFGAHLTAGTQPVVVGAASTAVAAIVVTPIGIATLPGSLPGLKACASVAVLGLLATGIAYIVLFELLHGAGATRSILITYLIPGVALAYGVLLLGEPLRPVAVAGLALVLGGVALAGRGRRATARRAPVPAVALSESPE
jgi:drug/metabolite transporter (DMT)-like permease